MTNQLNKPSTMHQSSRSGSRKTSQCDVVYAGSIAYTEQPLRPGLATQLSAQRDRQLACRPLAASSLGQGHWERTPREIKLSLTWVDCPQSSIQETFQALKEYWQMLGAPYRWGTIGAEEFCLPSPFYQVLCGVNPSANSRHRYDLDNSMCSPLGITSIFGNEHWKVILKGRIAIRR